MKKIIIIGCPGSGKSTLARALADKLGLPLYHLDMLYWNADRTTVERTVFDSRLKEAMSGDEWIIDGNYSRTMEMRILASDTVVFLDYPTDVCLDGVRSRIGVAHSDIPWVETEEDPEFIDFIKRFSTDERPRVLELIEKYGALRQVIILKSRAEADDFVEALTGR